MLLWKVEPLTAWLLLLNEVSKKIGLTWNTDVQALPNFKQAS